MSTVVERSVSDWLERAQSTDVPSWAYVDGERAVARSGRTVPVMSARDGTSLGRVPEFDASDVDAAVTAARRAFDDGRWSRLPPVVRKRSLLKLAELMRAHAEELALLITLDMGKPIAEALSIEVNSAINAFTFFGEAIDKYFGEVAPSAIDVVALVVREPVGVVGAVTPWNFPLQLACWKIAPALAAGNTVVAKPATQAPLAVLRLAELASEAGIPPGVLNVVTGPGATTGAALGRHMDVDKIAFTGSTEVGKLFLRYAAESNLKATSLECGGKGPHVVFPDAPDLEVVAASVVRNAFFNQGEVCTSGSRLIVHRSIHDRLIERVVALAPQYHPKDPLDPSARAGAIVDGLHTAKVLDHIQSGRDEGADLVAGGREVLRELGGHYLEPTVFDAVTPTMRIAREEIFGPVLSTLVFDDADEALSIANGTIYGLNAGIWTRDLTTAHKVARAIRAGMVTVNGFGGVSVSLPFGGVKQSGFGRDNSLHALDGYTTLKSITINLI